MNFKKFTFITTILACIVMTGCRKDDPTPPNEEELITTLVYSLDTSGGTSVELRFVDLDGDGGNDPVLSSGILSSNTTYTGNITLSNEAESPAEDITAEVAEEDAEHQLFFQSSFSDLSVAYDDQDGDGNPLGLATTLTTGASGTGTLTITLRHEPSKDAEGVSAGDITNAGGETDIEVTFNIEVQ